MSSSATTGLAVWHFSLSPATATGKRTRVLVWTEALTARATNRYDKAPLPHLHVERRNRPAMVALNAGLGTLAARAYELLDVVGHPVAEERLVQHVFGLTGLRRPEFWRGQLTRLLAAHDLFTQLPDGSWALAAWMSTSATLRSLRYVVVDVETTGLSPRTQTLLEIAALRCLGTQVIDTFTTLVNPGRPIPPFIRRFTGITDDMVAGAPRPRAAGGAVLRFSRGGVVVGPNQRVGPHFPGA